MENERKTDRSADMGMDEHRLSDILLASQIKATDIYETPPQIIWIDNSTIATLGNFSASTGKAKSKKTFNVSALVAASLAGKQVLNYRAHLPEGKQRILYVDTEQSRFHCRSVLERILRLAGLPTTTDPENLDFFCLREYSPSVRVEVIDYALRQNKGYGLVIIDGIRDLMLDINSTGESVEVINRMMEWSSRYDLHIHCVLHLNKGDNNVRGHIGTEMSNKAETVLVISKSNENPGISEVHALHIREKEFKPFAFTINETGLPVIASTRKQVVLDVVYQFGMFLVPRLSGDVSEGVYSVTYGFCLAYHVFSFVSVCSCILGLSGIRFGAKCRSMIFVMASAVLPSSCNAPTIQV